MKDLIETVVAMCVGILLYVLVHPYLCKNPNCLYNKWWFTK